MERAFVTSTSVVAALESSLYGQTAFSQAELEDEWSDVEGLRDAA